MQLLKSIIETIIMQGVYLLNFIIILAQVYLKIQILKT